MVSEASFQHRIITPNHYGYAVSGEMIDNANGLNSFAGHRPVRFNPNSDRMQSLNSALGDIKAQGLSEEDTIKAVHSKIHEIYGDYDEHATALQEQIDNETDPLVKAQLEDRYNNYYDNRDGHNGGDNDIYNISGMDKGELICQEFAVLTSYALNEVGIKNHYVVGHDSSASGLHAYVVTESGHVVESTADGHENPFYRVNEPGKSHEKIANGEPLVAFDDNDGLYLYSSGHTQQGNEIVAAQTINAYNKIISNSPSPSAHTELEIETLDKLRGRGLTEAQSQAALKELMESDVDHSTEAGKERLDAVVESHSSGKDSASTRVVEAKSNTPPTLTSANLAMALQSLHNGKAGADGNELSDEKAMEILTGQDHAQGGFLSTQASTTLLNEAKELSKDNDISQADLDKISQIAKDLSKDSYLKSDQRDVGAGLNPTQVAKDVEAIEQAAQQTQGR